MGMFSQIVGLVSSIIIMIILMLMIIEYIYRFSSAYINDTRTKPLYIAHLLKLKFNDMIDDWSVIKVVGTFTYLLITSVYAIPSYYDQTVFNMFIIIDYVFFPVSIIYGILWIARYIKRKCNKSFQ